MNALKKEIETCMLGKKFPPLSTEYNRTNSCVKKFPCENTGRTREPGKNKNMKQEIRSINDIPYMKGLTSFSNNTGDAIINT